MSVTAIAMLAHEGALGGTVHLLSVSYGLELHVATPEGVAV